MVAFRKMHGLGNDFVLFDARKTPVALDLGRARAVADRHRGIGCDQVIAVEPGRSGFDAFMRIYNADGGEVESCGNAARCVARLLMDEKGVGKVRIDTAGGALDCADAGEGRVTVDMGEPGFGWADIPLSAPMEPDALDLVIAGTQLEASALSTGNPHCVLFVENAESAPVAQWGPLIEHHGFFPRRTNVEFVQPLSRDRLRMRVWERGAGITLACGTGACAAAVAAHRKGLSGRKVDVVLDGGTLAIEWREKDDHILMTGAVAAVFTGEIDLEALA